MKKENGMFKNVEKAQPTYKIGAGVKATGVFARAAANDKKRGVEGVRSTSQANAKK